MKRWVHLLLSAVLAITLCTAPAGAATTPATGYTLPDTATAFTLAADTAYTNTVRSDSESGLRFLRELLAGAGNPVPKPNDITTLATLQVELEGGKTRTYTLAGNGTNHYLVRGNACRPLKFSDFSQFTDRLTAVQRDTPFYKYGPRPPVATCLLDGESYQLYAPWAQYSYRAVNGKFRRYPYEADNEAQAPGPLLSAVPAATFAWEPASTQYTLCEIDSERTVIKTVKTGSAAEVAGTKLDPAKRYRIQIDATFDSSNCRGSAVYTWYVNEKAAGGVRVTASASETHPGEVVVLRVSGLAADAPLATFASDISFTFPPRFFRQADGAQVALVPVSVYTATGNHWVEVGHGGDTTRLTFDAKYKEFVVQNLTVAPSTAQQTILSQKANAEYERVIAPLRGVADTAQHWDGRFILPVSDTKVTSPFGIIRYVNGSSTPTRHNALDLAVPLGTPVKATGSGRVLYAGFLQLTGNTVVIEHGYGLKSWYYHMDSLNAATDDMVTQSDVIGAVGSTGFSTGPHLHFALSVGNVFINPYTAISTDLLADL